MLDFLTAICYNGSMDKCCYDPRPCVSFEECLNNFDHPQSLVERWKNTPRTPEYTEIKKQTAEAARRLRELRHYIKEMGSLASTTCATHNNPAEIPIDQGPLLQLYRYDQPSLNGTKAMSPKTLQFTSVETDPLQ